MDALLWVNSACFPLFVSVIRGTRKRNVLRGEEELEEEKEQEGYCIEPRTNFIDALFWVIFFFFLFRVCERYQRHREKRCW